MTLPKNPTQEQLDRARERDRKKNNSYYHRNKKDQNAKEQKEQEEMQTLPTLEPGRDIKMIPVRDQNNLPEGTKESRTESYEPVNATLLREFSAELNVLTESTKLLHGQTKELLQPPGDPEFRKIDSYNLEMARSNMNTIAKLIQTKINFAKLLL